MLLGVVARAATLDAGDVHGGRPFVSIYETPATSLEQMLLFHDGQAFAQLATDPTLSRPEAFPATSEAAYRAARPLPSWLAWSASLGQQQRVAPALAGVTILGAASTAVGCALLMSLRGGDGALGFLTVCLPGMILQAQNPGLADGLGAGLATVGIYLWLDDRRSAASITLAAAALCRETFLVVPLALAVGERAPGDRRRALPLLVAPVSYAAWIGIVRWRFGAWPGEGGATRITAPLTGLLEAGRSWDWASVAIVGASVAFVALAVHAARWPLLTWLAVSFAGLFTLLGPAVWAHWGNVSRVALPLMTVALAAVLSPRVSMPRAQG